ncbi:hypothetical protein PINS_up022987 [Pythium insidiosum]|nr:hypothetical protein PINS_up022987 [Pythium insidiosum]
MQPLRNSLMGQFLPSALLDSPQLTPTRASTSSKTAADNQVDEETTFDRPLSDDESDEDTTSSANNAQHLPAAPEDESTQTTKVLERELAAFSLDEAATCAGCGRARAPVVQVTDCGHCLCRPCERILLTVSDSDKRSCPACEGPVRSLRRLDAPPSQASSKPSSRPSTSDSAASTATVASSSFPTTTAQVTASSGRQSAQSPMTRLLFFELFENIPSDDLGVILNEAGGQVSAAVEFILQRHPSFNPSLATEVSVMAGPGHSTKAAPAALHRSASSVSSQAQTHAASQGGSANTSSNWKTEMCMYYLQGKCNKTRRTCSFAHGESDLVRSSATTAKHTSSTSYKSRMCPLWLDGCCPKSRRECPLAHGDNDLRDGLAILSHNPTVPSGPPSTSGAGAALPPNLPTTAPRLQNYKTELCYYYLKGCCNYTKEECRFAHGESDLRTVESNTLEWSAQLANAAAAAAAAVSSTTTYPGDAYASPPASSSPAPVPVSDKASMAPPHQYSQQFMQQFQPQAAFGGPHSQFMPPPPAHQFHPAPHHSQPIQPGAMANPSLAYPSSVQPYGSKTQRPARAPGRRSDSTWAPMPQPSFDPSQFPHHHGSHHHPPGSSGGHSSPEF